MEDESYLRKKGMRTSTAMMYLNYLVPKAHSGRRVPGSSRQRFYKSHKVLSGRAIADTPRKCSGSGRRNIDDGISIRFDRHDCLGNREGKRRSTRQTIAG